MPKPMQIPEKLEIPTLTLAYWIAKYPDRYDLDQTLQFIKDHVQVHKEKLGDSKTRRSKA